MTWSIENVTEGEGAWIVRIKGESGVPIFERVARIGGQGQGFADIISRPDNPDRGADTSLDPATTKWAWVRPERSHWVGPGEWNVGEWNSLTLFEARDETGKRLGHIRLKLLVRPMLPGAKVPWTGTLLRSGDWEKDPELRATIGDLPPVQPKSETPKVVPDPKPATRPEVPKIRHRPRQGRQGAEGRNHAVSWLSILLAQTLAARAQRQSEGVHGPLRSPGQTG